MPATYKYMHTFTFKFICVYIDLYRQVQLQKLTNPSPKHLHTTKGQPLPAVLSKVSMKQKPKHRAVSHTCCHHNSDSKSQFLAPGLSQPLFLQESWNQLTPQSHWGTCKRPFPPQEPWMPIQPSRSWDQALTSAGSIPESPAEHGQRCQTAQPCAPHPPAGKSPLTSARAPFWSCLSGRKKINKERNK